MSNLCPISSLAGAMLSSHMLAAGFQAPVMPASRGTVAMQSSEDVLKKFKGPAFGGELERGFSATAGEGNELMMDLAGLKSYAVELNPVSATSPLGGPR